MASLINQSQTRKLCLDISTVTGRPFTRVSQEFLDEVEADLRVMIRRKIQTRPSIGKTLK